MKSLEELKAIREKALEEMGIRDGKYQGVKIVVGMATCGIAAGAGPILSTFEEEVAKENLDVRVGQTGCIGICQYEPVVEVFSPDTPRVTYIKMTPEKAVEVLQKHIKGGEVVREYTIGAIGG